MILRNVAFTLCLFRTGYEPTEGYFLVGSYYLFYLEYT